MSLKFKSIRELVLEMKSEEEVMEFAKGRSLNRLGFDLNSPTWYMQSIKKELSKRKIVKKLSESEQSLSI